MCFPLQLWLYGARNACNQLVGAQEWCSRSRLLTLTTASGVYILKCSRRVQRASLTSLNRQFHAAGLWCVNLVRSLGSHSCTCVFVCLSFQDLDGNRLGKLDGVRVQCVACLPDNKTVLAADTHKRVRAYVFDEPQDSTLVYVSVLMAAWLSG